MIKFFLLTLLSINVSAVNSNELNSIYTEAIWFVAVFATMSILSIIISKRQASKYVEKNPVLEDISKEVTENITTTVEKKRIDELLVLFKDDILTKEEFKLLEKHYA